MQNFRIVSRNFTLTCLLWLSACSGGSGLPVPTLFNENEPNDEISTANIVGAISQDMVQKIRGDIQEFDVIVFDEPEADVFCLEAIETTLVTLRLKPDGPADVLLRVTNAAGDTLAVFDEDFAGEDEDGEILIDVAEPIFYLHVTCVGGPAPYTLRVTGGVPLLGPDGESAPEVLGETRTVVVDEETGDVTRVDWTLEDE